MESKVMMGAVLISLLSIIFAGTIISVMADTPVPPNKFWGNASLNGEPAPAGTLIDARIEGELRGKITVTTEGEYGKDLLYLTVDGNEADDGKMIEFYVNGLRANETAVWYQMAPPRRLDLSVGKVREGVCGDINADTARDMTDIYMLLDHVGNQGDYEVIADVNCNAEINMGDVILLLNHVIDGYEIMCCDE